MEEEPIKGKRDRRGQKYWKFGIIGCAVLAVFIIASLAITIYMFYRTPYYQDLIECKSKLKRAGAALERYARKNDKYPDKLADLVPDYLPVSDLHCPADKSDPKTITYIYTKQDINAPGKAVLLTCDRHKFGQSTTPILLQYLKNGDVIPVRLTKG